MKPSFRLEPFLRGACCVAVLLGLLAGVPGEAAPAARPQVWAQPVDTSFNLYRMSPTLYRSALPDQSDVPLLDRLRVQTVVSFIKDDDRQWLGELPVNLVSLPMHADRVDDADVLKVLRTLQGAERNGPVLMHCKHGRDRTGLFAAMYRTVIQGWSKEEALQEMQQGGFGDPKHMDDAVAYVRNADIPALQQALASGECSTTLFDSCQVGEWLTSLVTPAEANAASR